MSQVRSSARAGQWDEKTGVARWRDDTEHARLVAKRLAAAEAMKEVTHDLQARSQSGPSISTLANELATLRRQQEVLSAAVAAAPRQRELWQAVLSASHDAMRGATR